MLCNTRKDLTENAERPMKRHICINVVSTLEMKTGCVLVTSVVIWEF